MSLRDPRAMVRLGIARSLHSCPLRFVTLCGKECRSIRRRSAMADIARRFEANPLLRPRELEAGYTRDDGGVSAESRGVPL